MADEDYVDLDGDFDDDDDESNESESSQEDESKEESGAADKAKDSKSDTSEALRKLQSERDKAVSELNKLLKRTKAAKEPATSGVSFDPETLPPEIAEWLSASKDNVRQQLYESDPRLKTYGVSPDLIVGETPADMRKSAKELQSAISALEGKIRNAVLIEHGFDPEPQSDERTTQAKSFRTMPRDEFLREVEKALDG